MPGYRSLIPAGALPCRRRAPTHCGGPIAGDGETTWSESLLPVGVRALLALGFFFAGA